MLDGWRKYNNALIPDLPPDIVPETDGVHELINRDRLYFARWTTDFDCKTPTSFWFLIHSNPMEIEDYDTKTRNQIRKGVKECSVRRITSSELMNEGYHVYASAFKRYKTYLNAKTESEFLDEIISTPSNWEYWGVFYKDNLIGYAKVMVINDYAEYRSIKFDPLFLRMCPSEALIYTLNREYLNNRMFKYVNNGARSISHDTRFPLFLIKKFKFRRAYCRLHIIYNKSVGFLVNLLFIFRGLLSFINFGPFVRINILLYQENLRRHHEEENF